MDGWAERKTTLFSANVWGQMKFLEALSQQGEQQIKLHNFCELWLLSEDPIQMWSSNEDNTLED